MAPPLPHTLEAERSILGAIVLKNQAMLEVLPKLRQEDLFLPQHRVIYSCMEELIASEKPIDVITLMDSLTLRGQLESAGGVAYLSQLADGLPRVTNINHYVAIVKEEAAKRGLFLQSQKLCLTILLLGEEYLASQGLVDRKSGRAQAVLATLAAFANSARLNSLALGLERKPKFADTLESRLQQLADAEQSDTEVEIAVASSARASATTGS